MSREEFVKRELSKRGKLLQLDVDPKIERKEKRCLNEGVKWDNNLKGYTSRR